MGGLGPTLAALDRALAARNRARPAPQGPLCACGEPARHSNPFLGAECDACYRREEQAETDAYLEQRRGVA